MTQITDMDLIEALQGRASIEIDFKDGGTAYWSGDHLLTVKLKIGSTTVAEGEAYLPNDKRESAY